MADQKRFKAINFDLDTDALRKLFGESGRRKAYYGSFIRGVSEGICAACPASRALLPFC
jgi:hypothetical protein